MAMVTVTLLMVTLIGAGQASTTEDKFLTSCNKYFYSKTPPTGFKSTSLRYVCQRYEGAFYFATLYDISHRIPLYSAYNLEEISCSGSQPSRRDEWFIEPELAGRDKAADMEPDKAANRDWVMPVQAINDDYRDSGYDRGHLNPNFMHCASARTATFSLTNSVPQDPCFNRIVWYGIESDTKDRMKEFCSFNHARRYIITGAVPSHNDTIPSKHVIIDDRPDKPTERVNVPSHSWTMSCCDASLTHGAQQSWWTGLIGENKAGGEVKEFTDITAMEKRLSELYGYGTDIKLLADKCGSVASPSLQDDIVG